MQEPPPARLISTDRAPVRSHARSASPERATADDDVGMAGPTTGTRVVEIHDRGRWNALVLALAHCEIEQGWDWGEVQRAGDWTPHRYAVLAGTRPVGVVAVASRRLSALPYSVLYASRGPLAAEASAWPGLTAALREVAARERAIFVRVSPSVPNDDAAFRAALAHHGFRALTDDWTTWNAARVVLELDIRPDEGALRQRLRKTIRQELGAAERRGVSIRAAKAGDDLLAFHRLMIAMGRAKRYPVRPLARLEALWENYVARGEGVLLLAERDGELVGGVFGLRFGTRAYLQSAAVARDGQRTYQGPLLYWSFIRWAKASGCHVIDWRGSGTQFPPCERDPGYGVYQFKMGFGSELRYWAPYHDLVFRPALYRLFRGAEQWAAPTAWRVRAWLNH